MQNFPSLNESSFIKTRRRIHSIAELIGKYREVLVEPIAKNDNLWLTVVENGFCTPPIQEYNELEIGCNPAKMIVEIANNKSQYDFFPLTSKTQRSISEELKSLLSKYGANPEIDESTLDNTKAFDISEKDAEDFSAQLINFHQMLKGFHKKINSGVKTQICLWPHHFDNAFKWFSGKKIDEQDEQMGIGVSNGDEMYELPYIYVTFLPALRKTNTLEIPEGAFLHDSDWTGIVLPYEAIIEKKNIDEQTELINSFFDISFASIQRAFSKR